MRKLILLGILVSYAELACASAPYPGLTVEVQRSGSVYAMSASFDTHLSTCGAYHYLTDYAAAKQLPGVIASTAVRLSEHQVKVDRTADERILFFHVRLRSVLKYTEYPMEDISFTQISGDSKSFQGHWHITPHEQGSTLSFKGSWEPDSYLPHFIIEHFAQNDLLERFSAVARLAEARTGNEDARCTATSSEPS